MKESGLGVTVRRSIATGNIFGGARHVEGKRPSMADEIRERQKVSRALAASIHHQFHVANILIWENPRSGVQHWREDCPALRRAKLGVSKLVPRQPGMTKACGRCAQVERDERVNAAKMRVAHLLAIPPPAFKELPMA